MKNTITKAFSSLPPHGDDIYGCVSVMLRGEDLFHLIPLYHNTEIRIYYYTHEDSVLAHTATSWWSCQVNKGRVIIKTEKLSMEMIPLCPFDDCVLQKILKFLKFFLHHFYRRKGH